MATNNKKRGGSGSVPVHRPKTASAFRKLHDSLTRGGYVTIDVLKKKRSNTFSLGEKDPSKTGATETASAMGGGSCSNGPLSLVAWLFDSHDDIVEHVTDENGNQLGPGYVKWGAGDNIPSTIPPLAMSSPYTAAPLRYLADLATGMGPSFMYRFPDGSLTDFRNAEYRIIEQIELCEQKEREAEEEERADGMDDDGKPMTAHKAEGRHKYLGDYVNTSLGVMTVGEAEALQQRQCADMTGGEPLLEILDIKPLSRRHNSDFWHRQLTEWQRTWYGYEEEDELGISRHQLGAEQFLEENNLNLHISQCMQDDVMLDIYFPTVGFDTWGSRRTWAPKINRVSFLGAAGCRLGKMNDTRHIDYAYYSEWLRTKGAGRVNSALAEQRKFKMYPACMPQHLLADLRYVVSSHQKGRIKERPMWVVCPTFYPSMNKPYYPQPAWWSVFTSKAFDFSATILYDKYKARENSTTWGKIIYISLDYLDQVFADEGYQGNEDKQNEFISELEQSMEDFLQHRENHGKTMRQWMWIGQDGKEHYNVQIVDVAETPNGAAKAGKEELELSTSPIFLALQVDPRLVGVPMVAASNGGTALREMALLKQQQLNPKQRLYESFLNTVVRFNGWIGEFHIKQMTLTTLDNSKTGIVETIAGEGA